MGREAKLYILVLGVAGAAAATAWAAYDYRSPFPGWWPLATCLFVATLLEGLTSTQLRVTAKGSTSFVMHLATALLFGGFWASVVAGISTLLGELVRANPPLKTLFNVSQRILCVSLAVSVYLF